jgi:ATP-dependent DNA ligase
MPKRGAQRSRRDAGVAALEPMEARSVDALPAGEQWQYEPKWDGFRCILARRGDAITLRSKSGEDLTRYFPELVAAALELKSDDFTLDGEIVVPAGKTLSFDALLQRIHPAASRVARLSRETPALFIAFDLLGANGSTLTDQALAERRAELEKFARVFGNNGSFHLSTFTRRLAQAVRWLQSAGGGVDGVIAKRIDLPYEPGSRDAMQKIKRYRSADCVIGGFRYAENKAGRHKVVGSLLLGLYDDAGLLHHVGFTSAFKVAEKVALTEALRPLVASASFTGNTPGGPSRWSTRRSAEWVPLKPKKVVEVSYDHFTGGRFRHGTSILRWRPDKSPRQCTFEQLSQKEMNPFRLLDPSATTPTRAHGAGSQPRTARPRSA